MGARGVGHIERLARGGAARRRHRDQRGHGTRGVLRRPRRGGAGEGRAGGVAARDGHRRPEPRRSAAWPPWRRSSPCPVLGYGVDDDADVQAEDVRSTTDLRPRFRLITPWGTGEARLALHGVQQVPNALAAAAAALWCGVPFDAVVHALSEVTGSPLRMEVRHPPGRSRRDRGLLQRQPGLGRGGAAIPRGPGLRPEAGASRPDGRARRRDRVRSTGAWRALAEELGIEVVGYQTGLYGPVQVAGADDAVALLQTIGPGRRVARQGQPGGAPRGRRARRTKRARVFSRRRPARSGAGARRSSRHRRGPGG